MKRLLILACVLSIACGKDGTPAPTTPTPNPFPLPADAPSDAAAPAGTSRITITTVEIISPDQTRVTPDKLKVTPLFTSYNMRVWIFCPAGLEGPQGSGWNLESLEFLIRKSDVVTNIGFTFSGGFRLDKRYTVIETPISMTTGPGQQRVTIQILRDFAVIARNEFVAIFN